MSDYLLIGPVLLEAFELPPRVLWGGRQRLAVHRLPGGRRVIDAMGRDDADLAWTGAFTGRDAMLRARAIDLMRAGGRTWPLAWGSFFYSVVIHRFEAAYERENWIPYRIACTVLRDEVAAVAETGLSLADGVLADVSALAGGGLPGVAEVVDAAGLAALVALPGALRPGTAARGQALGGLRAQESAVERALAERGARLRGAEGIEAREEAGRVAGLAAARGVVGRARAGAEAIG